MSGSNASSAIYVTDTPEMIAVKVQAAPSGGRQTLEEHRRLGADLDIDVSIQWLSFFLEDDAEMMRIRTEYRLGKMLTSDVKKRLVEVLSQLVLRHQQARAKVTDEMVRAFFTPRAMC